jgi:hypothetical protein
MEGSVSKVSADEHEHSTQQECNSRKMKGSILSGKVREQSSHHWWSNDRADAYQAGERPLKFTLLVWRYTT